MLIIAGTMSLDPTQVDDLMSAASDLMRATHDEPGCIEYVFTVDPFDPGTVRIFEIWESEEALTGHFSAPHMAEFGAKLKDVTFTGRSLKKYTIEKVEDL